MRKELCDYLIKKSRKKSLFFITGDLGFNALEPLEKQLGKNKKSVAFTVRLQPLNATFTDHNLEILSETIIATVKSATGGSLRS